MLTHPRTRALAKTLQLRARALVLVLFFEFSQKLSIDCNFLRLHDHLDLFKYCKHAIAIVRISI